MVMTVLNRRGFMSVRLGLALWLVFCFCLLILAGRWFYSELHFYQANKLISQANLSSEPPSSSALDLIDVSLMRYQHSALVIRPTFYDFKISAVVFRLNDSHDPVMRAHYLAEISALLADQTQQFPDYPFVWINNLRFIPLAEDNIAIDHFWSESLFLAHRNPLINLELALSINDLWPFLNREQRLEALAIFELGFSRSRRNARQIYASLTDRHARATTCLYLEAKQVLNADLCRSR